MKFDWQTDDEKWPDQPAGSEPAVSKSLSPFVRLTVMAIVVISAAAWYLGKLAGDRIDTADNALSAELLAAYDLLNSAVYQNDLELFKSFLSERNTYSRQLPLDLYRYGYFLDRPFLNLYAENIPPEQTPRIEFSPDLTRAELTTLQAYLPEGDPAAGPVWLERLTLFRKEAGQWQLTRWPIDEQFWGETIEERIGRLSAEFPGRDEDIGRRLAQAISLLLDSICGDAAINCPPNFRLKMLLAPYGQNLLDMNANYRTLPLSSGYDAYRIFLPAPTLAGRPIDEAGYQALYHGYASWIAAVLVQHYGRPRPVTHEDTAQILAQLQLSPPPAPVLPGPLVENDEPPPIPFPGQDILMVCQGYSPPAWMAYSPGGDIWQTISAPPSAPILAQLLQQAGNHSRFPPEGQGSLIRRPYYINNAQSWRGYLWLGGLTNFLETAENPGLFLAGSGHQQPDGDYLLFYPFDGQGSPYLAEAADCLQGNCRLEPLAGVPVWSPSGQATLLAHQRDDGTPQIYLGSDQGRPIQYLVDGYSPQWLDDTTIIFAGEDGSRLYLGRLNPMGSLETAALSTFSEDQNLIDDLQNEAVTHILVHPAQENWAVVAIANKETHQDRLLLFNIQSGQRHTLFYQSNLQFTSPFHITDDGRYLTVPAFETGTLSGGWQLLVFDLEQVGGNWQYNTGTAYFDWSADNQWLLIAEEDTLRLIAPHENYERHVPHALGCHTVGWEN